MAPPSVKSAQSEPYFKQIMEKFSDSVSSKVIQCGRCGEEVHVNPRVVYVICDNCTRKNEGKK
jgi:hypothetical protein